VFVHVCACELGIIVFMNTGTDTRITGMYRAKLESAKPIFHSVSDVGGFYRLIGRNTGYIIHPEEILADNFVKVVNTESVKNPEVTKALKQSLDEFAKSFYPLE